MVVACSSISPPLVMVNRVETCHGSPIQPARFVRLLRQDNNGESVGAFGPKIVAVVPGGIGIKPVVIPADKDEGFRRDTACLPAAEGKAHDSASAGGALQRSGRLSARSK